MLIIPFVSLLQITQVALQSPQKPPSTEVVIRGSVIQLPHLPERTNQARSEYGKVGSRLKEDLQDLEQNLADLYAKADHHAPLPTHLKVPKESADSVKFLAQMLNDTRYTELEGRVLLAWQEWQAALVEQGLAEWLPGDPEKTPAVIPSTPASEKENKEFKLRRAGMRKSDSLLTFEKNHRIEMTTLNTLGGSGNNLREPLHENASSWAMGKHAAQVEEKIIMTRSAMLINEKKAPSLSTNWEPFAAHMNECAIRLNDLEKPSPLDQNSDLRNLKVQAKLHFLERYRSSLWFCCVVWARMAAKTPPPPLRELGQ